MTKLNVIVKFLLIPMAIYSIVFFFYGGSYFTNIAKTYQEPGYDLDGSVFIKQAIIENTIQGQFSRFTDRVQYPSGWSMEGLPMGSIVDNLVIYPVVWFKSTTVFLWHNIGTIVVGLTSSLFAFYLCYYITGSYLGSLIGGYIYAFTGLNLLYTGGTDPLTHIEFIPLYLLCLICYFEKKTYANLIYVITVIVLNNVTSLYWGWFLYLTTAIIIISDFIFFKKYFTKLSQVLKFLFVFVLCSGLLSVLLNLNFFYQSGKYIKPSESQKINRSASKSSFTLAESPQRYILPSNKSIWTPVGNRFDSAKSYVPISISLSILFLLYGYKKLTDRQRWFFTISLFTIVFYILVSSTSLQIIFRTIMPPIVAYSRTIILFNLFIGIIFALFLSVIQKANKKAFLIIAVMLMILDTATPKALHLTNLNQDLPNFLSGLKNNYQEGGSVLLFPWKCARYGYTNLLFSVLYKFPIANPYFAPVDTKTKYLCETVNNYENSEIKTFISLFDVREIITYPNSGVHFSVENFEKSMSGCISDKKTYKDNRASIDAFDQFRGATIYYVSEDCRKNTIITNSDYIIESNLTIVEAGSESAAFRNFSLGKSKQSMLFKGFSSLDSEQYTLLKNFEKADIVVSKLNKYEYNIEVSPISKGAVITFNTQPINLASWKIYQIMDSSDEFSLFKRYTEGKGFFFETNLHKTSLYIPPSLRSEKYKIVFIAQEIDKTLKKISDVSTTVLIISVLGIFAVDLKSRYRKVYDN